jgi:hypothetical protein
MSIVSPGDSNNKHPPFIAQNSEGAKKVKTRSLTLRNEIKGPKKRGSFSGWILP